MAEKRLDLYVVTFGRPDLLSEQFRLLEKNLRDAYTLTVLDNTGQVAAAHELWRVADRLGVSYVRVQSEEHAHHEALNLAASLAQGAYWGTLDHDIFPIAPTRLIEKIEAAGFYGMGQTYTPRYGQSLRYLWPGWCFFSRDWLGGRTPDFSGIRGVHNWDDGDTGSMLHSLFTPEDWRRMPKGTHGYGLIREEDPHGLQSYGYETFDGAWLHQTNAANWKEIPDPAERARLFREMLAVL